MDSQIYKRIKKKTTVWERNQSNERFLTWSWAQFWRTLESHLKPGEGQFLVPRECDWRICEVGKHWSLRAISICHESSSARSWGASSLLNAQEHEGRSEHQSSVSSPPEMSLLFWCQRTKEGWRTCWEVQRLRVNERAQSAPLWQVPLGGLLQYLLTSNPRELFSNRD